MRYQDGDDLIDVAIRANGVDCPELNSSYGQLQYQTWIAVSAGQSITAMVDLKMSASQFQVDLVVDGVLRNHHNSTACPSNKFRQEKMEFFEGIHKIDRSLIRSEMKTSRITSEKIPYVDSDRTSVGTIEIIVYRYNQGYNCLRPSKLPEDVVDWEDLEYRPGTAGVEPTHEIVLDHDGLRLNDTGRRTWRRKAERPMMGLAPVVAFKYLYRHDQVLRNAMIIMPRRDILATAQQRKAMEDGLLQIFADGRQLARDSAHSNPYITATGGSVTPARAKVLNPYAVTERNGIRFFRKVALNPDAPGPQINGAQKRGPHTYKRKKRAASTYSTDAEGDTETEGEYMPSDESPPPLDHHKAKKPRMTEEVAELKAQLAAMREEMNQTKRVANMAKHEVAGTNDTEDNAALLIQHATSPESQVKDDKSLFERSKKRPRGGFAATSNHASDEEPLVNDNCADEVNDSEYDNPFIRKRRRRLFPRSLAQNDDELRISPTATEDDSVAREDAISNPIVDVAEMIPTSTSTKMSISHVVEH